jgi:hypothetical protein
MDFGNFGVLGGDGELLVTGQTLATFEQYPELTGGISGSRDFLVQSPTSTSTAEPSFALDLKKFQVTLGREPDGTAKLSFKATILDPQNLIVAGLGGDGVLGLSMTTPSSPTGTSTVVGFEAGLADGRLSAGGLVEQLKGTADDGSKFSIKIDDRGANPVVAGSISGLPYFPRPFSSPLAGYPARIQIRLNDSVGEGWFFAQPTEGRKLKFSEPPNDILGSIDATPSKVKLGSPNFVYAHLENPTPTDRFVQIFFFHRNFQFHEWQGTIERASQITGLPGFVELSSSVATPSTGRQQWFLRSEGSFYDSDRTTTTR